MKLTISNYQLSFSSARREKQVTVKTEDLQSICPLGSPKTNSLRVLSTQWAPTTLRSRSRQLLPKQLKTLPLMTTSSRELFLQGLVRHRNKQPCIPLLTVLLNKRFYKSFGKWLWRPITRRKFVASTKKRLETHKQLPSLQRMSANTCSTQRKSSSLRLGTWLNRVMSTRRWEPYWLIGWLKSTWSSSSCLRRCFSQSTLLTVF